MKFTINRQAFIKELTTVQRAISGKTTIPILTGVKLHLTNEGLTLTGSNADISIEVFLDATDEEYNLSIEKTGTIVLTARFFSEIIKKLPNDEMTIEVLDNFQTEITSGNAEFTINGLDADNYPHLPVIDTEDEITIPIAVFNQLISETVFAVSAHESRPVLTGIHLIIENNSLMAVATDSHRMSQRKLHLEKPTNLTSDVIIPGKSLLELSRTLQESEDEVVISITENQVLFKSTNMYFYSRLLEGKYPDTSRLIPSSSTTQIEFFAPELLRAIDRASLLSHEGRNNVVKLSITPEEVIIYGNSPDVGNVQEELSYEKVEGESLDISFNPDYMKDALRAFGQTNIKIEFLSPIRPFTLVPITNDQDFIQLITPVRTF